MESEKTAFSVLIVSQTAKSIENLSGILPPNEFSHIISVSTTDKARRILIDLPIDIAIINGPLKDDFGTALAIEISQKNISVLLFIKSELYEEISYKTAGYGILTISKPAEKQAIFQAFRLLLATTVKLKYLKEENLNLEAKMNEISIVNRAKWLLIERLQMSEAEAHRYIEKSAMDNCAKRLEIAENIISTYEN